MKAGRFHFEGDCVQKSVFGCKRSLRKKNAFLNSGIFRPEAELRAKNDWIFFASAEANSAEGS